MRTTRLIQCVTVAAALALAGADASAQERHQQPARPRQPQQHEQSRQPQQHEQSRQPQQHAQPRQQQQHEQSRQPQQHAQPRQQQQPHAAPRGAVGTHGVAVPRGPAHNVAPGIRVYPEPRGYGYARPHYAIPVRAYPRPYYVFRSHVHVGFGIYLGYPIAYPVAYGYPTYVYGDPNLVGQPPPGTYGGISLDIQPDDAQVSVDGQYVGQARDFSATHQPLTLTPGRHHVELQSADLEPLAFDVDIVPGQVIPYQGTMSGY